MFDALSDRLERISTRLRGKGRISEADLDEALGDIRTALLEADVELSVARRFCDGIRLRVSTESLSASLTPGQQVIKAVHEELVGVVGADLQRPAAVEQLRILGSQAGVTVFSEPTDPVAVARTGVEEARRLGRDVCI